MSCVVGMKIATPESFFMRCLYDVIQPMYEFFWFVRILHTLTVWSSHRIANSYLWYHHTVSIHTFSISYLLVWFIQNYFFILVGSSYWEGDSYNTIFHTPLFVIHLYFSYCSIWNSYIKVWNTSQKMQMYEIIQDKYETWRAPNEVWSHMLNVWNNTIVMWFQTCRCMSFIAPFFLMDKHCDHDHDNQSYESIYHFWTECLYCWTRLRIK